jgi:MOSC domain-containing protein YiiM
MPGGGQNLTLIEGEVLDLVLYQRGIPLTAGERRRNLTTRGIRLNHLVGKRFYVGNVFCEGVELCEPCDHLSSSSQGSGCSNRWCTAAACGANTLTDGVVRVGDEITEVVVPAQEPVP